MTFYWCLKHDAVEDSGCANSDRLGPYATREQAASALDSTAARTAEQDARDKAEDDW